MSQFIADNLVLATYSLFITWMVISIPFLTRSRSSSVKFTIALIVFLAARFIPIFQYYSLAYIMFGAFGNLSIVTMFLLLYFIYAELVRNNDFYCISQIVFFILVLLAALLYLSVFGYLSCDVYSWGYYPAWMLLFYVMIQIVFSIRSRLFAILWLIALISFIFKIQTSINFWDYLFDPLLISISIFYLLIFCIKKILKIFYHR